MCSLKSVPNRWTNMLAFDHHGLPLTSNSARLFTPNAL
jgi:hypothetical protein